MAKSTNSFTQLGPAGLPQMIYGSFTGKTVVLDTTSLNTAITVGTTATLIRAVRQARPLRLTLLLCNNDASQTLYYGQLSSLTTATGMPLEAGDIIAIGSKESLYQGPVYGIVASGTVNVRVWEILDN